MPRQEFIPPATNNSEWEKNRAKLNICSVGSRLGWTAEETRLMLEAVGLVPMVKESDGTPRSGKGR